MTGKPLIDLSDDLPTGIDQFHVANKDDEYYYCWLNKKADNLQRMKDVWGYEIIGSNDKESALVPPNAVGERVNGDLILARMPRERYEKIMRLKAQRAADAVGAANAQFSEAVERAGLIPENSTKHTTEVLRRRG